MLTLSGTDFGKSGGSIVLNRGGYSNFRTPSCVHSGGSEHEQMTCNGMEGGGTLIAVEFDRPDTKLYLLEPAFSFLGEYGHAILCSLPRLSPQSLMCFWTTGPSISSYACSGNGCRTKIATTITFSGTNFGFDDSDVQMQVGGVACPSVHINSHLEAECALPEYVMPTPSTALQITVGGQTTISNIFHYKGWPRCLRKS